MHFGVVKMPFLDANHHLQLHDGPIYCTSIVLSASLLMEKLA